MGQFDDIDRLTAFADNLVPHTLRMAGVLRYDDGLAGRIAAGELLDAGEPAEVEIRACGVHAVELLAAAAGQSPAAVDQQLWQRGQSARGQGAAPPPLPHHLVLTARRRRAVPLGAQVSRFD